MPRPLSGLKRRPLRVLLPLVLGLVSAFETAHATVGTIDPVPSATLLLPYFEIDLANADGVTTLFSINNASASAVLAHVVLWSDLSVPVLDFNVYLTGYDVQTINLRDVLVRGVLPGTASVGQDPQDAISPGGDFGQDINFASCTGQLPLPPLPPLFLAHIQSSLTGRPSAILGNRCAGLAFGDSIARGYVTVDVVSGCTLRFPGDPGYFAPGGTGDATNQNVLWGDFLLVEPRADLAIGNALVHIEADATNPETSVPGQYTFYGRYVNWTAADNREPLATNFAARFLQGGAFEGGTDLLVWRDSKVAQGAFTCGSAPSWFPLGQESLAVFDEEENLFSIPITPVSPQPPDRQLSAFPAETFRTQVGGAFFAIPFNFGWLYLDLNHAAPAAGNNPPEDPASAQAFVAILASAQGRFSVGYGAVSLDSAISAEHFPDLIAVPSCDVDSDSDGTPDCRDCAPADPTIHPGAKEIPCNGKDENCDCDTRGCQLAYEDCLRITDPDNSFFCGTARDICLSFCADPPHNVDTCPDGLPPGPCRLGVCNGKISPTQPICPPKPATPPTLCGIDDPNSCTRPECDGTGKCVPKARPATFFCGPDDPKLCTRLKCDGKGACVPSNKLAGIACTTDDGNPCTDPLCDGKGTCGKPVADGLVVGSCPTTPVTGITGCSISVESKKRCKSGNPDCTPIADKDFCKTCGVSLDRADPTKPVNCGGCVTSPCGAGGASGTLAPCVPNTTCKPPPIGTAFSCAVPDSLGRRCECQTLTGCPRTLVCWFPEDAAFPGHCL